jgi:TolB-like protein/Flp pilus assembly protein TadD
MSEASRAVFLSYASQDSKAAGRLCEALRANGIEVWFDQSELRGGDVWDQKIRHQIRDCAIFIPIISRNSQTRTEGYFRLEWRLADQRTHLMARSRAFLAPVCIDQTREAQAEVPESFTAVQWTRLPDGSMTPAFATRIAALLNLDPNIIANGSPPPARQRAEHALGQSDNPRAVTRRSRSVMGVVAIGVVIALASVLATRYWTADHPARTSPAVLTTPVTTALPLSHDAPSEAAFDPPAHSVAVLSFVNMSGDTKDEYFSDGLSEELLNALARINELQVAARTSSFSFKGTATDIQTIGKKLNVHAVLEGSVRKAGGRVRITAQLIDAVSGYHLWSETYDRELRDIFALQSEIASAVASALKVTLLGSATQKDGEGGTVNPKAFDAYLRGRKATEGKSEADMRSAIKAFDEAIALDPSYALAYARRGEMLAYLGGDWVSDLKERDRLLGEAKSAAERAVMLAPASGRVYSSLAFIGSSTFDYASVDANIRRALALEPGNAEILGDYAFLASKFGRADAVSVAAKAVALSPLDAGAHRTLGIVQMYLGNYGDARISLKRAQSLSDDRRSRDWLATNELAAGKPADALQYCRVDPDAWTTQQCLAIAYFQLNRKAEATAILEKMQKAFGDGIAYQYAEIYAQWGQPDFAIQWLETAHRLKDGGLIDIKVDPFLKPIRSLDRYKEIIRRLNFPT